MSKAQEVLASIAKPQTDEAADLSKVSDNDLKKIESDADALLGAGVALHKVDGALMRSTRSMKALGLESERKKAEAKLTEAQDLISALAYKANEMAEAEIKNVKSKVIKMSKAQEVLSQLEANQTEAVVNELSDSDKAELKKLAELFKKEVNSGSLYKLQQITKKGSDKEKLLIRAGHHRYAAKANRSLNDAMNTLTLLVLEITEQVLVCLKQTRFYLHLRRRKPHLSSMRKRLKKAIDTILKSVTSLGNGTRPLEGTTVSKAVAMVDGEAADRVIGIRQELDALNNELSGIAENIRWQLRNREDD